MTIPFGVATLCRVIMSNLELLAEDTFTGYLPGWQQEFRLPWGYLLSPLQRKNGQVRNSLLWLSVPPVDLDLLDAVRTVTAIASLPPILQGARLSTLEHPHEPFARFRPSPELDRVETA